MTEGHADQPTSFPPSPEFAATANATADLYDRADADRLAFWAEQARRLTWDTPFTEVLDWSQAPVARWFVGGKLNVAYNCVDRHVEAGNGDRVAIHWEGEPVGDARTITYRQLQDMVCQAANTLTGLGLVAGDRVAIYMPMVPEAIVAMGSKIAAKDMMRAADHVIDLGPGAGVHGGQVMAQGSFDQVAATPGSITGQYLTGVREIAVPITTARRISLTTWAAWITPERVISIREPSPTGATLTDAGWRKPRIIDTGASAVLELRTPFAAATGNLTLEVISPAYTFVNGAESTAGFVAETDTVLPPLDEIMRATLVEAYENLMSRAPTRPAGDYRALWEKQLTDCRQTIRYYDFDRPQQPTSEAAA